ncbi:unnamed protein product [Closterium sp. NIES-54]
MQVSPVQFASILSGFSALSAWYGYMFGKEFARKELDGKITELRLRVKELEEGENPQQLAKGEVEDASRRNREPVMKELGDKIADGEGEGEGDGEDAGNMRRCHSLRTLCLGDFLFVTAPYHAQGELPV